MINEAPPAIISIFIGTYLKDVLKIIEDRIDENSFDEQDNINLRLDLHNRIPDIFKKTIQIEIELLHLRLQEINLRLGQLVLLQIVHCLAGNH
ncbi:MAG: hypothetical protein IPP53_15420 [Bacteroidetes bacterium]|nr:hypothetical protein [Bacteroidota bacterium]